MQAGRGKTLMYQSSDKLASGREAPPIAGARQETLLSRMQATVAHVLPQGVGGNALALADQTVVSLASFLTTIIIGRFCGTEELGRRARAA